MKIKESPIGWREYYTKVKKDYSKKLDEVREKLKVVGLKESGFYNTVLSNAKLYKDKFNIDVFQYEEFVKNEYIDGKFLKVTKGMFLNRNNNYELTTDLYNIYTLATLQKDVFDIFKEIEVAKKIADISMDEYRQIVKAFYTEVQRQMIMEGKGYVFEGFLGWTCINRCKAVQPKATIDYVKTKQKEEEVRAAGLTVWRKEEEDWCKANGLEYNAVDCRVFRYPEAMYEIPLLGCKLPDGTQYKLEISDYRDNKYRGKTLDDIAESCNNNIEEICKANCDMRMKLNMSLKIDKTLYTKYIRNENQQPLKARKARWKNR